MGVNGMQGLGGRALWRAVMGLVAAVVLLQGSAGVAQENLFAPAVTVNGQVVTQYELRQRVLFMTLLHQPGDILVQARQGLIEDKLRRDAAKRADLTVTPDQITAGMAEFASRAKLTSDQFLKAIAQGGVEPQAFRDFVEAGLMWRAVVRDRFAATTKVSEAEIDRAIGAGAAAGGDIRVLLSEIVLPTGGAEDAMTIATRLKASVLSEQGFAIAAKNYSKSDTAAAGGALDWISAATLPPAVAARVMALKVGEITDPISVPGAVQLYLLRDISQGAGDAVGASSVEYARFVLPIGTDVAALRASVDTCDDLYARAVGLPEEMLLRETMPEAALPLDIRAAIAGLDDRETAMVSTGNGGQMLIMLCRRQPQSEVPPSRDEVRGNLVNRKLAMLAAGYLEELRSEAIITEP